ncbi:MAG: hypothetical protein ACKVZJ_15640 [Phycisphaerales bacterium]
MRIPAAPPEAIKDAAAERSDHASFLSSTPTCPRCGYDLSGAVASWRESCPLRGVCSECGLDVEWARVLTASEPPRWFVEGGERFSVWRAALTLVMLCNPIAFWSRVRPHHPVRLWRAAGVTVLAWGLLLAQHFAAGSVISAKGWSGWVDAPIGPAAPQTFRSAPARVLDDDGARWMATVLAVVPLGVALFAATATASLGAAKVRWKHLFRAAVYAPALLAVIIWLSSTAGMALLVASKLVFPPPAWPLWVVNGLEAGWALAWLAAILLWWWAAFRFYLRLERAFLGAIVTGFAGLVAVFVVLILVAWAVEPLF